MNPHDTLCIDAGNTSLSAGIWDGKHISTSRKTASSSDLAALKKFFNQFKDYNVKRCAISSVAASRTTIFKTALRSVFSAPVSEFKTRQFTRFLDSGIDVRKTGIDRVLGCYQASSRGRINCIVIDAGTAITIDVVYRGFFRGGVIIPGIDISRMSLALHTERVRPKIKTGSRHPALLIGRNTDECVKSFLFAGIPMMIDAYIKKITQTYGCKFKIVGCGGDSLFLSGRSDYRWQVDENLILTAVGFAATAT